MENGINQWYSSTYIIHPPMEFTHGIVSGNHPWYLSTHGIVSDVHPWYDSPMVFSHGIVISTLGIHSLMELTNGTMTSTHGIHSPMVL